MIELLEKKPVEQVVDPFVNQLSGDFCPRATQSLQENPGTLNGCARLVLKLNQLHQVFNAAVPLCVIDKNFIVQKVNHSFCELLDMQPEQLLGKKCLEIWKSPYCNGPECMLLKALHEYKRIDHEIEKTTLAGKTINCLITAVPYFDIDGNINGIVESVIDISDRVKAEKELTRLNEILENERRILTEKNLALKHILEHVDDEKEEISSYMRSNIKRVLLPILDELRNQINPDAKELLEILKTSLMEIVSPFVRRLEESHASLSARETEICNLIKLGKSTKEIAGLMHTSAETVRNQRKNIRRKLSIKGEKVNLASYLRSLSA